MKERKPVHAGDLGVSVSAEPDPAGWSHVYAASARPPDSTAAPMVSKDVVARSLSALMDDWHRKGGQLSYDDFTRVSSATQAPGRTWPPAS